MTNENETAETEKPTELEVLNGGVEITVVKIDGSQEQVKVRQLPIRFVPDWAQASGDVAFTVELLCDKVDRSTEHHLSHARAAEFHVVQLLSQAPFEQVETIEKRLQAIRTEIAALEKKARWSDSLTDDSIYAVVDWGERLNAKRFARWSEERAKAIRAKTKTATESLSASSQSGSHESRDSNTPAT